VLFLVEVGSNGPFGIFQRNAALMRRDFFGAFFSDEYLITKAVVILCASFFGAGAPLRAAALPLSLRSSMSWYTLGTFQEPVENSPLNPDNSVLGIQKYIGAMDFRPDLRLESNDFKMVARPQLKTSVSRTKVRGLEPAEHAKSVAVWNEVYGQLTASEMVLVSYGLQNYQWGAAELLNPSNQIFHETIDSKGILSPITGRNVARVNLTWTKNLSTVLMSETEQAKNAAEFRAEETFQTKALMKNEVNWNSGAEFFGVVFGAPEKGSPWLGEYFNFSLSEGLAIYGDASQHRQSSVWHPVTESSAQVPTQKVVQLRQSKLHDNATYTTGVIGLRYSFVSGSDLRLEYLGNGEGWTKSENESAMLALDTTNALQMSDYKTNLSRVLKPGLEYRGQRYAMISLRIPDAIYLKDLVLYGRAMRSLSDFGSRYYGTVEYGFGQASTLILAVLVGDGPEHSDLRGVVSTSITAGLREDF
jgi:hypothetical protein